MTVRYGGTSHIRTIRKSDFVRAGVEQDELVFNGPGAILDVKKEVGTWLMGTDSEFSEPTEDELKEHEESQKAAKEQEAREEKARALEREAAEQEAERATLQDELVEVSDNPPGQPKFEN